MTIQMLPYLLLGFFSVFISSISQVLLKKSLLKQYDSIIREYMNFPVIIAYSLFFGSTLLTMFAYRGVPLSMGPMFESSSYIFVTVFGSLFFAEKITKRKLLGLMFIIGGIIVYAL